MFNRFTIALASEGHLRYFKAWRHLKKTSASFDRASMPPRRLQQEQMDRPEQIVLPHYVQWDMFAVAIKEREFLPMIIITSLSAKRDSHDISVKTSNTYSSQLTALQICKFLHVRGPAAGAKPYNTLLLQAMFTDEAGYKPTKTSGTKMLQTYESYRTYKPTNLMQKAPQPGGPVGAADF